MISAIRTGAGQARKAAEEAIPRIKSAAADAAYWMAYGVSFAAAFQWTLAKHLTPEQLKSGWRDGVKAGDRAAEHWMHKTASNVPPPIPLLEPGPSAPPSSVV